MKELYSPRVIAGLLEKYQLAPLKKLGQNFLKDEHVVKKIAMAAVGEEGNVLEIGPGLGVLTHELACRAKKVVAVEIDAGMVRVLKETMAEHENVTVIHRDVLKADLKAIAEEYFGGESFSVAGNLPYYITSKCLLHVLESGAKIDSFTAMVQREVADRLSAGPGQRDYGALSASVAYYGKVEKLFSVSSGCFFPAPDVDSAIIQFLPGKTFPVDRKAYVRAVRGLFEQRRKTVLNNFKREYNTSTEDAMTALQAAGISPLDRAEALSPEDFARLAEYLGQ
ncbi:MAG: 16S rRNA (adenine(1518)-N(6)/adenine(1519)-N(6))-dimethyltransferase RsmA [Christensenellaceae bacterium]|nr:16S rRNA (adenine(1518)-N(6)/adenine(1519)-N(6))-dimethyltransferase RsmA [Christensenellaceae bacterium]